MKIGIWSIWILHQLLTLIMILNFLIAIISTSYENVITNSVYISYL